MTWFLVQGIPVGGGDGPQPSPPGIWGPTDPRPTHPIAGLPGFPGYQPPGIWGPTDPRPTHPIAGVPGGGGQPPLGIWGPGFPYPDQGLPGQQPGGPVYPSHPIFYPPYPSQGPGFPTHPIVIPPGQPPAGPDQAVAIIPAGTTIVSTADIEIPNPSDPENPFVIPAGTIIVTSQALLIPTGYNPPPIAERPVPTPHKEPKG